jgi:hypothetical protein
VLLSLSSLRRLAAGMRSAGGNSLFSSMAFSWPMQCAARAVQLRLVALEREDFLLLEAGPVLHDNRARKAHVVREGLSPRQQPQAER